MVKNTNYGKIYKLMNTGEQFPSLEPSEKGARYALLLNMRSTIRDGSALDERHVAFQMREHLPVLHRYRMFEGYHPAIPVASWRLMLAPERPSDQRFGIRYFYLRTPSHWDPELSSSSQREWSDYFVETVDTEDRHRYYYVNSETYLQYEPGDVFVPAAPTPSDQDSVVRDLYTTVLSTSGEPTLSVQELNNLMDYRLSQQPTRSL